MSRKENRYLHWLIYLALCFSTVTASAQSFDPIAVGESLTQEVSVGSAALAQWESLRQAEAETLANDAVVQTYFDTHFDIDGAYGELKSGQTVTDWEALAQKMGTTGIALAGAYALWRRRRQQYLANLRSGDSEAIEALFEEHFTTPGAEGHQSAINTSLVPVDNEAWKVWAEERGLPGAGATIAALYALWVKRRNASHTNAGQAFSDTADFFEDHFEVDRHNYNYRLFYQDVHKATDTAQQAEINEISPQFDLTAEEQAQKDMITAQVNEAQRELTNLRHYRMYFSEFDESRLKSQAGTYNYGRNLQGYTHKLNRMGYTKSIFSLGADIAVAEQKLAAIKAELEPFESKTKAKNAAISSIRNSYDQILRTAHSWWSQQRQTFTDRTNWLSQLTNLKEVTTQALEAKQSSREEALKEQLTWLAQSFSPQALTDLLNGEYKKETVPLGSSSAELEARLANLPTERESAQAVERFNRQAAIGFGLKVTRDRNGRLWYSQPYYNERFARWENRNVSNTRHIIDKGTELRDKFYDDQAFTLEQEIAQAKQAEFKHRLIQPDETNQTPELLRLQQFLGTIHAFPDHPYVQDFQATLEQIRTWKAELAEAKHQQQFVLTSFAEQEANRELINTLESNIENGLGKLVEYQEFLTAAPTAQTSKSSVGADVSLLYFRDQYCCDEVYKFVEAQAQAKAFYKKYGQPIEVLEDLKLSLAAQIDAQQHLEGTTAYSHGYHYYDYQALKRDYEKVLQGEMPDVYVRNWSWYNSGFRTKRTTPVTNRGDAELHRLDHLAQTVFNVQSGQAARAEYKARETLLFNQREAEFDAQYAQKLEDHFSTEQIARYHAIKANVENAEQQYQALSEAEAAVATARASMVQISNQRHSQPVTQSTINKAIEQAAVKSLDLSQVTPISYSVGNGTNSNTNGALSFEGEALRLVQEAYRSAYGNESRFITEAQRMLQQKSDLERKLLIAQAGIAAAPEPLPGLKNFEAQTDRIATFKQDIALYEQKIAGHYQQAAPLNVAYEDAEYNFDIIKNVYAQNHWLYQQRLQELQTAAHNRQVNQNKLAGDQKILARKQRELATMESTYAVMAADYNAHQAALRAYNQTHAPKLATIDASLAQKYGLSAAMLAGYYQAAKELVEAKKTEIIDTRDRAELVDQYNGLSSEHPESIAAVKAAEAALAKVQAEAAEKWQTVTPLPVITNTAFASQKTLEEGAFAAWVSDQVTASNETEDFASSIERDLVFKLREKDINLTQEGLRELTRVTSGLVLEASKSDLAREGIVTGLANNVSSMGDVIAWLSKWITKPFSSTESQYYADYLAKNKQERTIGEIQTDIINEYLVGARQGYYTAGNYSTILGVGGAFAALKGGRMALGLAGMVEDAFRQLGQDLVRGVKVIDDLVEGRVVVAQMSDGTNIRMTQTEWEDFLNNPEQSKVGQGLVSGDSNSFPVQPGYGNELVDYPKEFPFDAQKMINDGLITKTRYNINELDTLLDDFTAKNVGQVVDGKQGEIIFVMKENGEMVFSMRRANDYLPHPVLSHGEDVLSAGTITKLENGVIEITRKSGHFKPSLDSLEKVSEFLKLSGGYRVISINPNF